MTYAIVAGLCAAGAGFFGKLPSLAGQQEVTIYCGIRSNWKNNTPFLVVRLSMALGSLLRRDRTCLKRCHVDVLYEGSA